MTCVSIDYAHYLFILPFISSSNFPLPCAASRCEKGDRAPSASSRPSHRYRGRAENPHSPPGIKGREGGREGGERGKEREHQASPVTS